MLCKIDCTLGTTDEKARAINFLRAVRTVMTAAANTTPTSNVVTAPGIYNSSINVITEVVSNVETGGWTATSDSNVADNYNASLASYYQVDFVSNVQTGKATYPYMKCTLTTNMNYPFSGTYTTYPYLDFRIGFNNAASYSNTYSFAPGTLVNNLSTTANIITAQQGATGVSNSSYPAIVPQWGEYLIASTSRYVALLNSNAVTYFGYRTTNSWEDIYTDNPPIVAFSTHTRGGPSPDYSGQTTNGNPGYLYDCTTYCAWMYTQGINGNVSVAPQWRVHRWWANANDLSGWSYSISNNSSRGQMNPLSGTWYPTGTSSISSYPNSDSSPTGFAAPMIPVFRPTNNGGIYTAGYGFHNAALSSPLMFMRTHSSMITQGGVTDPVTGTQVPAAYPLVFQSMTYSQTNSGGTAYGIYKSSCGSDMFLANIFTPGSTYTVGTESYYGYRVGFYAANRDIFLIRKA